MSPEPTRSVAGRSGLGADLIAQRGFMVVRRGYDQDEVRAFLDQVATEVRALHSRVDELKAAAESAAAAPAPPSPAPAPPPEPRAPLDEDEVVALVGEQTAAVLRAARAAAVDLRLRAEGESERIVADAREAAVAMRQEAEAIRVAADAQAQSASEAVRAAALAEADAIMSRARADADALREQAEQQRRLTVDGAQAMREKILGDLSRRRRVATVQIEQLRAGRERLLESYAVVRRTLEEVHDELQRADAEARTAADDAGRRAELEADEALAGGGLSSPAGVSSPTGGGAAGRASDVSDQQAGQAERDVPAPTASKATTTTSAGEGATGGTTGTDPGVIRSQDAAERVRVLRPNQDTQAPAQRADTERTGPPTLRAMEGGRMASGGAEPVRIVDEPVVETPDAAETAETAVAGGDATTDASAGPTDDLFARMRSNREASVAAAQEVLGTPSEAPEPGDTAAVTAPVATAPAATAAAAAAAATAPSASAPEGADDAGGERRSDEDEAALQQRDRLVADTETALTRRLKRVLQDEQNELLDRLRHATGSPDPAAVLPDADGHLATFAAAADSFLTTAAAAGAGIAGTPEADGATGAAPTTVAAPLAERLATALVEPLRRRLGDVIREGGEDQAAVVEAIGTVYRECKTQRVEPAVLDAVVTAFAAGTLAAAAPGTNLRWVVEDVDGPCADCDDNALAGYLPKGEAWPTGQLHPPAHAGCRCMLVPAP